MSLSIDPLNRLKKKRPSISNAETEIARLLWDLGEGTVRQVLESLPADRDIDYKTVQTYLRRLEEKGYVQSRKEGRQLVYSPKVSPQKVIGEAVSDFVKRLFHGKSLPLVEHLIEDQDLSAEEISRLRELLDDLEQNSDESS